MTTAVLGRDIRRSDVVVGVVFRCLVEIKEDEYREEETKHMWSMPVKGNDPRGFTGDQLYAVVRTPRDTSGRFVRTPLTVWFETTYTHNGKREVYRTRSHTATHERLRRDYNGRTVRCDKSIPWPFGTYAEVIS